MQYVMAVFGVETNNEKQNHICAFLLERKNWVKTLSYGMMHMAVAIMVAYALSGSWKIALGIGIIEPLVQTFAYHFHEKFWKKIEN
jgi:uncharacterized membrane protein